MPATTDVPYLPCPECRLEGVEGNARIGNRRVTCRTCNRFAQAARNLSRAKLIELFPQEAEQMRVEAEMELYPRVIEAFKIKYPAAR